MKSKILILSFIITITAIILTISCPNPINEGIYNNMKDEIPPEIIILSPAEDSYCANFMEVRGTVTDKSTKDGKAGKVKSLGFEVTGTTAQGMIPFESDGSFSFEFNTKDLANTFTLNLSAEDWNQNRTRESISLRKLANNNIPSFKAVPGDREITLTWDGDAVPKTESYDLYYTTNGSYPTENYGEATTDISSFFVLSNLKNGNRHVFLLRANAIEGEDNWSDYEEVIPLSSRTLVPVVIGDYQKIIVEWHNIPGADEYEVWRATEEDGEYVNLAGSYKKSIFIDTDVIDGQEYFYKIQLTEYNDLKSEANSTQTAMFPAYPKCLGSCSNWGYSMYDVFVRDNYAYVAHAIHGLHIYDVSDPSNPKDYSSLQLEDARGLAISGNHAYLANGDSGLRIIDITDPSLPQLEASCDINNFSTDIFISGDYVYVSANDSAGINSGMQIVDITDPSSPQIKGWYAFGDNIHGITVSGDYAYIANCSNGLQVIDISNPDNPVFIGQYNDPNLDNCTDVFIYGGHTYLTNGAGASGVDLIICQIATNPFSVTFIGQYMLGHDPQSITVSGDYAYIADHQMGLQIVNVADPANPYLDCSFKTLGLCNKAEVVDNLVYIVEEGIFVVDIAKPFTIDHTYIGQIELTGVRSVAIRGEYAYIANEEDGVQVYDISNPNIPDLKGSYDADYWWTTYVVLSKDYAYCANGDNGFNILDITTPSSPIDIGFCGTPGEPGKFFVRGEYAYIPDSNAGLQIIDLSDPVSPVIVGSVLTGGMNNDVFVTGNYAYIACGKKGLVVVDVSNPSTPAMFGSCVPDIHDTAMGVFVKGNYAYVADGLCGLQIINITNPAVPVFIKSINTPGYANSVVVSGYYAYVADGEGGWHIINCSDPTAPMFYDSFTTDGDIWDITINQGYVYVTDHDKDSGGVYIFELESQ